MRFDELEALVAVARHGSLSGAARTLGVPRSTVGRRISRLEETLDTALLERTTRSVHLTEIGREVFERGRTLLDELDALREEALQWGAEPRGLLRVAGPAGLGRGFFAEFVSELRARYPRLSVQMIQTDITRLPREYDVVIAEGPLPDTDWIAHPLAPANQMLVAHPAYLEARGEPTELEHLAAHDCLAVTGEHDRTARWPLIAGGALEITPIVASNDIDFVREAALAGSGIALLSLASVGPDLAEGRLKPVLAAEVGRASQLYALYSARRKRSPKVVAFVQTVDDYIQRMGSRYGVVIAR